MAYEKLTQLALSFPILQNAEGLDPWDAVTFLRWLCSGRSGGGKHAGQFILMVWNCSADWRELAKEEGIDNYQILEPFNVVHAMAGSWDDEQRAAFLAWAQNPFMM